MRSHIAAQVFTIVGIPVTMIPVVRNQPFDAFDQGIPLNLTQHDAIHVAALKSLPYFHCKD